MRHELRQRRTNILSLPYLSRTGHETMVLQCSADAHAGSTERMRWGSSQLGGLFLTDHPAVDNPCTQIRTGLQMDYRGTLAPQGVTSWITRVSDPQSMDEDFDLSR